MNEVDDNDDADDGDGDVDSVDSVIDSGFDAVDDVLAQHGGYALFGFAVPVEVRPCARISSPFTAQCSKRWVGMKSKTE